MICLLTLHRQRLYIENSGKNIQADPDLQVMERGRIGG